MKVKLSAGFRFELSEQVKYIARDKPGVARHFKNNLIKELKKIPVFPYSYRRSIFFNDEDIRDLIYIGYVITFRISRNKNLIEVFGFTKYKDFPDHSK